MIFIFTCYYAYKFHAYNSLHPIYFSFVSGVGVVMDTIRRIVAARALKNLMTVYTVNMVITHRVVRYITDSPYALVTLICYSRP